MCGRFTISKTEEELEKRFGANFYSKVLEARYNVAPTQNCAVLTNREPEKFRLFRWGLIPFWAKDPSIGSRMINARAESIMEKPAFKNAFHRHRCLIPADGFYEWEKRGATKVPYRIHIQDKALFAFAGIWERWKDKEGNTIHSFAIITVDAAPKIKHIHDRMPVILLPDDEKNWLAEVPDKDLAALLKPYPDELLDYYTVSTMVNSTRNESPDLLEPVDYSEEKDLFS